MEVFDGSYKDVRIDGMLYIRFKSDDWWRFCSEGFMEKIYNYDRLESEYDKFLASKNKHPFMKSAKDPGKVY